MLFDAGHKSDYSRGIRLKENCRENKYEKLKKIKRNCRVTIFRVFTEKFYLIIKSLPK